MIVTWVIIFVTVIVSVLANGNIRLFDMLKFNAYDVMHQRQWYRVFTYGFIHAGYMHLFINLLVLYSFGRIVETMFAGYFAEKSSFYYILLYLGGITLSIIPALAKHKNNVFYNAVGASGAVSAVVFSSILLYPAGKIFFFFIPIGIPAPVFGVLYLIYEAYMSRHGRDNIGHDAHLWGAIFGVVFTIALEPAIAVRFLEQIRF